MMGLRKSHCICTYYLQAHKIKGQQWPTCGELKVPMRTKLTNEIILAAIDGFESQKKQIDSQITELRLMLNGGRTESAAEPETPGRKRKRFSAAARRRMREAQQRRWAAVRGEIKPSAPTITKSPTRKRHLSAAGRKAIIAASKRRWALKRAETAKS